jgi:glycosyltransferase involved in cell wall biosynthesis
VKQGYIPQVSVIIPVYNGEAFIEEALESVFAQTFKDFEVIVINDGSTDGTEQRLQKYQDRMIYLKQRNQGLSASRRTGLGRSNGPLVAFLDADDVWLPQKLERQVEAARQHPECGIITTDCLSFCGDQVTVRSLKEWYKPASGDVLEKLLFGNWIPPSAAMVRRECFEVVKTFDVPPPCYGEDWLMWMEISARYPVHFIDEVLVRRRLHSNSMSSQGEVTQFRCVLRNLDIIRQRVPRLNGPPSLIDEAAFRVCLKRGIRDIRAVRLPQAREKLRLALRYKPRSVKAWAALAATCVPKWALYSTKRLTVQAQRIPSQPAGPTLD